MFKDVKVGDRAKIIGLDSISAKNLHGRVGTVITVNTGCAFVTMDIEGPRPNGIHFYEIEPAIELQAGEESYLDFSTIHPTKVDPSAEWRKAGRCPECGELGPFVRGAMTCSTHGAYGGV